MAPVITLTTDFGTRDPYVAAVKGVLFARAPGATIVDLSHDIEPQDVLEAALFLAAAVPYFPAGTVHLAIVDPGVGSSRRPLAASIGEQLLVAPDNGLLTLLSDQRGASEAREIVHRAPPADEIAPTFHGRDVFAPTAAALASGAALAGVGPPIPEPVRLDLPAPRAEGGVWMAQVIHVDRFGNAVTNVHRDLVGAARPRAVLTRTGQVVPFGRTYADVAVGAPLALMGSAGYLEVAVNQGRGDELLGLRRGDEVQVLLHVE